MGIERLSEIGWHAWTPEGLSEQRPHQGRASCIRISLLIA